LLPSASGDADASRPLRLAVRSQIDVERARREARELAERLGFGREAIEDVALAISELATNLVRYAHEGTIVLREVSSSGPRRGLELESRDVGPGIADVGRALQDGVSSGASLGSGLPAVQRLMDEFNIRSDDSGTQVVARKWLSTRR
jgi:serine/threonine-protein kinase RsbT